MVGKLGFLTFWKAKLPKKQECQNAWRVWFDFMIYYAEYLFVLSDFIKEVGHGFSTASNCLLSLETMYSNQELGKKIHAQLKSVKDKAPTLQR